eukprot:3372-Amphidinium_carterae.1
MGFNRLKSDACIFANKQKMGFNRLKSDACIFANKQSSLYLMAYVDDLLVVGDAMATQQFLH